MGPNKENIVGWFEIAVDDMKRAKNFYETVFELKLEKLNVPSDSQADLQMMIFPMSDDATGSPGALLKMDGCPAGNNSVVVYFSCQDYIY